MTEYRRIVAECLRQDNGVERIIALVRDGKIPWEVAAEGLDAWHVLPQQRARRLLNLLSDTFFGR